MEYFDTGVNAALWLTLLSAALCIYYGARNWNSDGIEDKEELRRWAETEDKIEEGL